MFYHEVYEYGYSILLESLSKSVWVYLILVWIFSTELLTELPLLNKFLIGCYGKDSGIFCSVISQCSGFVYIIKF